MKQLLNSDAFRTLCALIFFVIFQFGSVVLFTNYFSWLTSSSFSAVYEEYMGVVWLITLLLSGIVSTVFYFVLEDIA
jgi:hypothetical protein